MAITALTTLRDDIMLRIPRCPAAYVTVALRETAVEFFRSTEVWRKELAAQDVTADEDTYALAPGVGTGFDVPDVWRILTVQINDEIEDADHYMLDLQSVSDVYGYYLVFLTDYIPDATVEDGLVVTVVLVPNLATGWCEPIIMQQYSQALINGTLARLFSLRTRPWADAAEASFYEDLYEKDKARARIEREQAFVTSGELKAHNPEGWL